MPQETAPLTNGNGNGNRLLQGLRITVVADIAMIVAMVTLVFWVGRQAERIDTVQENVREQGESIEKVVDQTSKISGQMLQMSSASNVAEVTQRVSVAEARLEAQEAFARELKSDVVTRLTRIENKIDQR